MTILFNSELNKDKWMSLLDKGKFSSPFQTPDFFDLMNSVDGFKADVFGVEKDGEYKALIVVTIQKEKGIKGFFSIRGIVYGGPVILPSEYMYLEALLDNVKSFYKKKLIYLEIRNNFDYRASSHIFEKYGWNYEKHLNVQLSLENLNVESILGGMKYNRRREIKLSYKEGAFSRLAENEKEVLLVYDIIKQLYTERVKLPLYPISFFLNLYRSNIGKVFVVIHNDRIIGGSFCIYYENRSINTMYYAGLRNYHKKIFPTHLAIMSIIEFAITNNLKMVDFMGAGKPDQDYGVRDFKLQFGGELVEHGRFSNIFKPLLYNVGKAGLQVMAKI